MKWLQVALLELAEGVAEVPGPADNPRIREYHAATSLGPSADEVPWCSSFVNWCMQRAGLMGTHSAAARSWESWGRSAFGDVSLAAELGPVAVLSRTANPKLGHVGFLIGQRAGRLYLLGGNQGNRVSIAPFPSSRLVALRLPLGAP